MRFAVLASPDSWYFRDLARASAGEFELSCLPQDEIACEVTPEGDRRVVAGQADLSLYDAVLVRTMPPGSLEQVVFRMDALSQLEAQGVVVVNPPKAIEAAVDKFLTTARLAAAGLRSPRTIVCQTCEQALAGFESLGGDVVVKPLFGSEGRGITRVTDEALAQRAFGMLTQLGAVLYLQEFIPHYGHDIRLFVIGQRVLGMKRVNELDWRTNVSRGATAEPYEPNEDEREVALRAAHSVGALVAGVDFLPGRDGEKYVLEVNAVPGWKALARALDRDIAKDVLNYVRELVVAKGRT
jgi:ribosomal protein S6--L-glutamate ligase